MSRYFLALSKACCLIFSLLVFYAVFRICFFLFNQNAFTDLSFIDFIALMFHGVRFDLSAILALNGLLVFLLLLPFNTLKYRKFQKVIGLLFIIINSIALLFEASDWIYFAFNHKRATVDILTLITSKGDFLSLLPDFLRLYWYLLIPIVAVIYLYARLYKFIDKKFEKAYSNIKPKEQKLKTTVLFLWRTCILLFTSALIVVGIRGGFQFIPINIRNAIEVSPPKYTAIVLNTPFSIINSWQGDRLEEMHFMSDETAKQLANPIKQYSNEHAFQKKNVVIIIVEGLSKEFTKLGGVKSYTPFLDSLMDQSMTFNNAYANGLHSNEGLPAIVASIPALMEEPITTSIYSNNHFTALPALLDAENYTTAFYHGATNGSMSFDIFSKEAGYQKYFGRTEYNNEKDYDGSWGIYDEPFLQYFIKGMNNMSQPFMTTVFTVTSHHPFPLPAKYKNTFPKGTMPVQESIGYTDFAIRRFFETASKEAWYKNTLFVITADHCSPYASNDYYASGLGRYQIPIIFFAPGDSNLKGMNTTLMQQIDIQPSILDYLGYKKPFFSFGSSAFATNEPKFMAAKLSGIYNWVNEGYQLKISDNKIIEAYQYPLDSLGKNNLVNSVDTIKEAQKARKNWEAFVQIYNSALINNKMFVPSK
jgi:phosphoglycerol transferase MdoB-like AlkP superfamily enzyme